jgi:hypothetical protein
LRAAGAKNAGFPAANVGCITAPESDILLDQLAQSHADAGRDELHVSSGTA